MTSPSSSNAHSTAEHEQGLGAVQVCFVRGSLRERAAQYAAQISAHALRHPDLPKFWTQIQSHVLRGQMPAAPPAALAGAAVLVDNLLLEPLWRGLDPKLQSALETYVAALPDLDLGPRAQIDRRLARVHLIQDALAVLTGLPLGQHSPAGPLGCSALVALPDLCAQRDIIFGRNFDLVPHGHQEPPVLVVHHPQRGLAHVSLHHGGGFTPGATAINEAGLCLAVHQNFTRNVSLRGTSVLELSLAVIERCSSLSAALEMLRRARTAGGWTFVLADTKRQSTAAVEIDANGAAALFPPGDFLSVANCYRTRKKAGDFAFSGAWREHNWSRLSLLNRSARRARGQMDPLTMAEALSDHTDAYDHQRVRALGNTVSAIHNVDAAIFAPGHDALYVATGTTPRNSSDGFFGLRLSALFADREEPLPPLHPVLDPDFRSSLRALSQGCRVVYEGGEADRAEALFEQASTLFGAEPIYRFLGAALKLRRGAAEEAAEVFSRCVGEETSPYRRGMSRLMQARALDVLGNRGDAKRAYEGVAALAEGVDPLLVRRAAAGRARAFTARRAQHMVFDTLMADVAN